MKPRVRFSPLLGAVLGCFTLLCTTPPAAAGTLAEIGVLDVTTLGAHPDDAEDDTAALQQAIDRARDLGLVAYFPPGEYLVSDTLRVVQPVVKDAKRGRWFHDRRVANALVGADGERRATLKLAPRAAGFDRDGDPKALVWIWSQPRDTDRAGSPAPEDEQPNISFNQVFIGIDIDIGAPGNAGAVGLRHAGSQGSTIEDVHIRAQGAYAGLYNPPGQGGGTYDVTIEGGRFGVWADHQARYPILAGIRLEGQDEAALYWKGQSNLTLAGFSIRGGGKGPVITLQRGGKQHSRAITMVDGVISGSGDLAIDNRVGKSLYLRDVYVEGFTQIVASGSRAPIARGEAQVVRVDEYAFTSDGNRSLVRAGTGNAPEEIVTKQAATAPDADAIIARHLWKRPFPSFQDADLVSVTDFGARGDDRRDDTEAFRKALAKHDKVLVPKGTFIVSDTLTLGPNQHLFGVAKHLSIIEAASKWKAEPGVAIITTADDAAAHTSLSSVLIERPRNLPTLPLLDWRAGRNSVVRDISASVSDDNAPRSGRASPDKIGTFVIRGNGGGRWYGLSAEWNRMNKDTAAKGYRHLAIRGTHEPLAMYGLNIERGLSDPQIEIADAANIGIYYLKSETLDSDKGHAGVLQINRSQNVSIFGYSGNAQPSERPIIRVDGSKDVVIANVLPVRPDGDYDTISINDDSGREDINGRYPVTLLRSGTTRLPFAGD